jgi:hypothetical protein
MAQSMRFGRDDVVLRKGRYMLVGDHFTPREAMIADLVAVHDALVAADIDVLLVRGDNNRPVIALDRRERKRVRAVLAEAFADEPFYSRTVDYPDADVLVADGVLSTRRKAAVFRLFRPRLEPVGRLRYGADNAFQLEFWRFGDDEIVAPRPNALMRTRMPRSEAVEDTVDLYGRTWRTIEHMFMAHTSDLRFPIDIVFSWVDGSSEEFQRERAKRMQAYVVGDGDDHEARFRQIDELKYALRSVHMFAPWVRNIYIATDSPAPAWLADHPRVRLVRSEEFFADLDALPTHNSMAVEAQLHRIDGLSEHFLYSNDDMFFGRPLTPDLFFSPGGITKFVEAGTRIGLGESDPARSGFENSARVNRRLLQERFGAVTTRHLEHCAAPLRVSVLDEMERDAFPAEFASTAASAFRAATNISVTNSLYHYYALMTGRAVVQSQARVKYIETTLAQAPAAMEKLLRGRNHDMFCLNDGSKPEISVEERTRTVIGFLERYFPFPAPWERQAARSIGAEGFSSGRSAVPSVSAPPERLASGQ